MLREERDELSRQARHPATLCGPPCNPMRPALQPYVSCPATLCGPPCNPMRPALQPYAARAATLCGPPCNPLWLSRQAEAMAVELREMAELRRRWTRDLGRSRGDIAARDGRAQAEMHLARSPLPPPHIRVRDRVRVSYPYP